MRNKKINLMLRCLAFNDLVALLGMLIQMWLYQYLPLEQACSHNLCVVRVLWRWFGLGSGCVAVVMAVERWLALTHPFLYQKFLSLQKWKAIYMVFFIFRLGFLIETHCAFVICRAWDTLPAHWCGKAR
ncbi:hypothetical protein C0J52_22770 [Blattella germanica]|nr:hypothetical protein C0J52_22770 [Blattella germanica]